MKRCVGTYVQEITDYFITGSGKTIINKGANSIVLDTLCSLFKESFILIIELHLVKSIFLVQQSAKLCSSYLKENQIKRFNK